VLNDPHFKPGVVEFVLGPTQLTLPRYSFTSRFHIIFIDGPHGFPFPNMEYYFFYPHLVEGGLLIVDDIHIPTIHQLYEFLKEDVMFEHMSNVGSTAFFRRTAAPLFDPLGDGWWLQNYNKARSDALSAQYYPVPLIARIYKLIEQCFGVSFAEKLRVIYRNVVG
jgi:hypothetical protein